MRKFAVVILSFVLVLSFSGCFGSGDSMEISSLSFAVVDNTDSETDSPEIVLTFEPDYDLRNLSVHYVHSFPEGENVDLQPNVSSEGMMGGDVFDRFEEVVELLTSDDFFVREKGAPVKVTLVDSVGTQWPNEFSWGSDYEGLDLLQAFYTDIISRFEEDIY